MSKDINRLKVVLAEKKRTNKWLAEQLGKDPATVSKWCTNTIQPNVETLVEIAKHLNVGIQDLFWPIENITVKDNTILLTSTKWQDLEMAEKHGLQDYFLSIKNQLK